MLNPVEKAEAHLKETAKELAKRKDLAGAGEDTSAKSSQMMFKSFEDSLKLFVTSIKYQDPMDPVDTSKMAEQTFQLAQAQAQHALLGKIEEQNGILRTGQILNSSNLIGKVIEVNSDQFFKESNDNIELAYILPMGLQKANVQILDAKGQIIHDQEIKPLEGMKTLDAGRKGFVWNGEVNTPAGKNINKGNPVGAGEYKIRVLGFDENGQIKKDENGEGWLKIETMVKAPLTGTDFRNNVPKVIVSNHSLPLSSIVSIQEKAEKPMQEALNRFDAIRNVMVALPQEDQKELEDLIRLQSKAARKLERHESKLEKKVNHLTPEQYNSLTKEIENRFNKVNTGA